MPCPAVPFRLNRSRDFSMSSPDHRCLQAFAALNLTPREAEVLFWISQGKSNHDIGIILGAKTVTICAASLTGCFTKNARQNVETPNVEAVCRFIFRRKVKQVSLV